MGAHHRKPIATAALLALLLGGCANADLAAMVAADPKLLDASRDHAVAAPTAPDRPSTASVANTVPATSQQAGPQDATNLQSRDQQIATAFKALERGDAPAAERLLVAVQAGEPDWRLHSGLGIAASALGRQADAQTHFKRALQLSPRNPAVLNNLAISHMLDRNPSEAEVVLKRATADGNASRETLDNLALARSLKAQMEGRAQ
jgi:Flp pilus assembly protein TadD